jgi:hypothetical protein
MQSIKLIKKQVLIILVFSVLLSIGGIIHGIFFDLDFAQIKRLTFEGIILTLIVVFPAIIFLEWVFDLNNKIKFNELEKKINSIKK